MKIIECVPNFSEGRDAAVIDAIKSAIDSVADVSLLHVDPSPGANRTVMTFAGPPEAVAEAAFRAVSVASERIDMRRQVGVHPRIGATDVCPLIPLRDMTMAEADDVAHRLGTRIGEKLYIPVFLYENSAKASHRRALPDIRKGQYEGFAAKMQGDAWVPDFGPRIFNPATGATVLGARNILVAFNISIRGGHSRLAANIAAALRERGPSSRQQRLSHVRAIGWHQPDYDQSQVSMNLLDYRVTSPLQAFEACRAMAEAGGGEIVGCELIGCIPEECLAEAGMFALAQKGGALVSSRELLAHEGVKYLGLSNVRPFDFSRQVLEWALRDTGLIS